MFDYTKTCKGCEYLFIACVRIVYESGEKLWVTMPFCKHNDSIRTNKPTIILKTPPYGGKFCNGLCITMDDYKKELEMNKKSQKTT